MSTGAADVKAASLPAKRDHDRAVLTRVVVAASAAPVWTLDDLPTVIRKRVTVAPNGCWLINKSLTQDGYAKYQPRVDGRQVKRLAHRVVYELLVAPIPAGRVLDHICHGSDPLCDGGCSCRHRRCVNPAHLEAVTSIENTQRGVRSNATHCKRGHPFAGDNLLIIRHINGRSQRMCRACRHWPAGAVS